LSDENPSADQPVASDIREAWTLPAETYTDDRWLQASKEAVFAKSWQLIADLDRIKVPGAVHPTTLMPGVLDEPLLLTRGADDQLHCLSNVCTHRGHLVCEHDGIESGLRCRYHGRRFGLDGRFASMPEFDQTANFPTESDSLPSVPHAAWNQFLFASANPSGSFEDWIAPVEDRLGWLPVEQFRFAPGRSRDYLVQANWALYCDNFLEGFHIPYVHAALADALDYGEYNTELFEQSSLQLGIASDGEATFDLPEDSPDFGKDVAAYYWFLYPNLMLNFYPWGLSINVVQPQAVDRTKVSFRSYVWKEELLDSGAGAELDRVEREDEVVVENVHQGLRSRFYDRGRFSPTREQGVHHFHRLLADALSL